MEREEEARRSEFTAQDDEVTQTTDYTRDYGNAVRANLTEWARGTSQSHAAGAAVGAGGVIPNTPVVIGGGVAGGSAYSGSTQDGGRQVSSTEQQNLRDAIRQHANSLRQLNSTVVTETSQRETTEAVSEIIANPNFCHSLTVLYYDILRHLQVDTELAGVSECLFVPFAITPFMAVAEKPTGSRAFLDMPGYLDVARVIRHRDALERALLDRKLAWVFPYLSDYASRFSTSSIPAGRRMDQDVVSLRGTLDIEIEVASPLKGDEDFRGL